MYRITLFLTRAAFAATIVFTYAACSGGDDGGGGQGAIASAGDSAGETGSPTTGTSSSASDTTAGTAGSGATTAAGTSTSGSTTSASATGTNGTGTSATGASTAASTGSGASASAGSQSSTGSPTTASSSGGASGQPEAGAPVTYAAQVKPIVSRLCVHCHTEFDQYENLVKSAMYDPCTGRPRIVPGAPDQSLILLKVQGAPPCGARMPQDCDKTTANGPCLTQAEIQTVHDWIAAGALNN